MNRVVRQILCATMLVCCPMLVAADISIEEIEQRFGVTLPADLKEQSASLLDTYNKDRGNKSLAAAFPEAGGWSIGLGLKAESEFLASNTAIAQCQNRLKEFNMVGSCEVVLLGDQLLTPGSLLRGQPNASRPAMAWRVDGINGTVYLVGTIHLLKQTLLPLPPVFDQFFSASDAVAFETNPILFTDPARQAELAAAMFVDPKNQKKLYSKADRKLLKKYLKTQSLPLEGVYTAPPVISAMQLSQLKAAAMGYNMATGVEMHYARQASTNGKAISELETPMQALAPLFALSPELQVVMLTETVAKIDEVVPSIETLISTWFEGDAQEVYNLTIEDMVAEPRLVSVATGLLDQRNINWMPSIEAMLESDTTTVVMVGSAHFGGEKGLLALLRDRGFEPVQYNWGGQPITTAAPDKAVASGASP